MKKIMLGKSNLEVPAVAVGCMRIGEMEKEKLVSHIQWCMENGLNFLIMQTFTEADSVRQYLQRHGKKQDLKEKMQLFSQSAESGQECMIFQKIIFWNP